MKALKKTGRICVHICFFIYSYRLFPCVLLILQFFSVFWVSGWLWCFCLSLSLFKKTIFSIVVIVQITSHISDKAWWKFSGNRCLLSFHLLGNLYGGSFLIFQGLLLVERKCSLNANSGSLNKDKIWFESVWKQTMFIKVKKFLNIDFT